MKRFITFVGMAALVAAACGAGASPTPMPAPVTPTAAPPATVAPNASPSAASVTVRVTFDGQECSYEGPAVVQSGTQIAWAFENTPAAIEASTKKGAESIGSDLVILPAVAGTTWETVVASLPAAAGTKGDWGEPAWALMDELQVGYGSSTTVMTVATGSGYYVGCHLYWNFKTGTPYAFYPATLVQVLKG